MQVVQYTIFLENIAIWDVTPLRLPQIKVQRHIFSPFFSFQCTGLAALYETTNTITQKQNYEKDFLAKKKKNVSLFLVFSFCRYLATLYSHPDYTREPHVSHKILPEIRSCVEKHWQVHLSPPWSSTYLRKIIAKSLNGQPVSFTDFYGYLVGQQLLKGVSSSILIYLLPDQILLLYFKKKSFFFSLLRE